MHLCQTLLLLTLLALLNIDIGEACFGKGDDISGATEAPPAATDAPTDDGSGDDGSGDDGSGGGGNEPDSGDVTPRQPNALDKIGKSLDDVEQYDNSAYDDGKGSFVTSPGELSCDFEGDSCCWGNENQVDDLDYLVITSEPDLDLWETFLESDNAPEGRYVATAAVDQVDSISMFNSCGIQCAKGPLTVKAGAWGTGTTAVQACTRTLDDSGEPTEDVPSNCQALPFGGDGEAVIELSEQLEKFQIVLLADGFADPDLGDIVVIDNIEVDFEECSAETESGGGDCAVPLCDFEDGICEQTTLLSDSDAGAVPMTLHDLAADGTYSNPITGISQTAPTADGDKFLVANLTNESPTTGIIFPLEAYPADGVERTITYDYYASANGQIAKICFGGDFETECTEDSRDDITPNQREWLTASEVPIPAGATQAIIGSVYNTDINGGRPTASTAFGLDNIQLNLSGGGCAKRR